MPIEALIEDVAMQHLAQLAAQVPADQAIVEVGTHHAANLCNMAHAAKQSNGAKAFGVDAYGTGDIRAPRDSILAAGRYLAANGFVVAIHCNRSVAEAESLAAEIMF